MWPYSLICLLRPHWDELMFNTLRPRYNDRHFKWNFFMKVYVFQMKFHWRLSQGDNIPALLQIMDWRRPGPNHYLNQCCNIVVSTLSNIFCLDPLFKRHWYQWNNGQNLFKRQLHCVHLQMLRCMCRNRRYFEKMEKNIIQLMYHTVGIVVDMGKYVSFYHHTKLDFIVPYHLL